MIKTLSWEEYADELKVRLDDKTAECAQLKETNEALEAELKEVCDVLIRKCPEMKDWVMMNWKNLYEVQDENI